VVTESGSIRAGRSGRREPFVDRDQAGRMVGERVAGLRCRDPVVLALPRGGVPVGYQVALAIGALLDVIVVRKLGVPFQPELAMGAIGEDGVRVMDEAVVAAARVSPVDVSAVEARERAELDRRVRRYRSVCGRVPLAGRTAIVADDGMATGSTAQAACLVARAHGASQVILATPVASPQATAMLGQVADQVVALEQPDPFVAVGRWYLDFGQLSDDDVLTVLAAANTRSHQDPSTTED
jgi:putative phosphoribosyl transferase